MTDKTDIHLPPLRQEIKLLNAKKDQYGRTYWTLFDPITHRFFRIDKEAFQMLSLWRENENITKLKNAMKICFEKVITEEKIQQLIKWLEQNFLIKRKNGQWKKLSEYKNKKKSSILKKIIHNYIFFKVPLLRPQKFLHITWPYVRPLFSKITLYIITIIGICGIYLTSRQWDAFIATLPQFLSLKGVIITLIAFTILKIAHELGHAWMAQKYQCKIPTMGVIFILLYPVLYTDISDTWKLGKERFIVAAAGLMVEISMAAIALLLWNITEPGNIRNTLFAISTIGILFSLAVNLNPFLRFDGYYLLSDMVDIENLQHRAFEIGKWKLREILFKLNLTKPEPLTRKQTNMLILWAWGCWIYRFFLFLAIALLIYAFFFKILGVILFIVEIMWFIIMPIIAELKIWYKLSPKIIRSPRALLFPAILIISLISIMIPWKRHITIHAIIEPENHSLLFAPQSAEVKKIYVKQGQKVKKKDVIAQLHVPKIDYQLQLIDIRLKTAQLQHKRLTVDKKTRNQKHIIENQIITLNTEKNARIKEREELKIYAPISGKIAEVNQTLYQKRWITQSEPIARIISHKKHVRGYIRHADLKHITENLKGRFIPNDIRHPILNVSIKNISRAHAQHIDIPYLAAKFQGEIDVDQNQNGQLIPRNAFYQISMHIEGKQKYFLQNEIPRIIRGSVHIEGKKEAPIKKIGRKILHILLRESGI